MVRRLIERFDSHVAMCSAFGLAVVAAAPGNEAEAADFVYYQPNGGAGWVVPASVSGIYINVETQAADAVSSAVPGWVLNPWGNVLISLGAVDGRTGYMQFAGGSPASLAFGTVVSSAASFGVGDATFGGATGNWQLNASNYVGFKFVGVDNGTKYGWLRMDVGATSKIRTIMEVGYSTITSQSITVGQGSAVPEPSTVIMGLLAGGAAGIVAWRRQKASA